MCREYRSSERPRNRRRCASACSAPCGPGAGEEALGDGFPAATRPAGRAAAARGTHRHRGRTDRRAVGRRAAVAGARRAAHVRLPAAQGAGPAGVLVSESGGYAIRLGPARAGPRAWPRSWRPRRRRRSAPGTSCQARELLNKALDLWDGEPLAERAGPVRRDPARPAGGVAAPTARDPARHGPGAGLPRRGGLRADRADRGAPAARAAARAAHAGAVPQRPAGGGARRLRRHAPAARRRAGRRPAARPAELQQRILQADAGLAEPRRSERRSPRRRRSSAPRSSPPPCPTSPAGPPSSPS